MSPLVQQFATKNDFGWGVDPKYFIKQPLR